MIPIGVIQIRADICGDCATPCADRPDVAQACAACPIRKWGKYGNCQAGDEPTQPEKMRGLGDLVAKVAQPIAKVLHIESSKCRCAKRQAALNRIVPFG